MVVFIPFSNHLSKWVLFNFWIDTSNHSSVTIHATHVEALKKIQPSALFRLKKKKIIVLADLVKWVYSILLFCWNGGYGKLVPTKCLKKWHWDFLQVSLSLSDNITCTCRQLLTHPHLHPTWIVSHLTHTSTLSL